MSDLDYDARLTDGERDILSTTLWQQDSDGDPRPSVFAAVERIVQARLLDLAQRAEAAEAAVERVRALADDWESWAKTRSTSRIDAFRDAAEDIRAALDREEDQ